MRWSDASSWSGWSTPPTNRATASEVRRALVRRSTQPRTRLPGTRIMKAVSSFALLALGAALCADAFVPGVVRPSGHALVR